MNLIERLKEKVSTEWVNGNDRKLFTEIIQNLERCEAEIARKDKLLTEAKSIIDDRADELDESGCRKGRHKESELWLAHFKRKVNE